VVPSSTSIAIASSSSTAATAATAAISDLFDLKDFFQIALWNEKFIIYKHSPSLKKEEFPSMASQSSAIPFDGPDASCADRIYITYT
jgi:hypothetical protein